MTALSLQHNSITKTAICPLAPTEIHRSLQLKDKGEFPDGSGIAVRFDEHPSRYVLRKDNPAYHHLAAVLVSVMGVYATYVLDWSTQSIVDIKLKNVLGDGRTN